MDTDTGAPYVDPVHRRRNQDHIYHFALSEDTGVMIEIRKVRVQGGDYKALFWARSYNPGIGQVEEHLHLQNINLTSGQTKSALVKTLTAKAPHLIDWAKVVEYTHTKTFQLIEEGEPPVDMRDIITSADDRLDLIDGILPLYQPTTMFADGGTGKSVVALLMAAAAATGQKVGPFKPLRPCKVLYLDWETVQQEQGLRFNAIFDGLGIAPEERPPIHYLCMKLPLVDAMEHVERTVDALGIDFIVIDSIAPALGGPVDAEWVNPMFDAIRQFENVTTLIISHVTKADRKKNQTEAFGSVFVHNRSRAMWSLDRVNSEEEDIDKLLLTNRKRNRGKKGGRYGLILKWEGDVLKVLSADPKRDRELAGRLPYHEQVYVLLQRGAKTVREIAQATGKSESMAREAVNRLSQRLVPLEVLPSGEEGGRPATRYGIATNGYHQAPIPIHDLADVVVRREIRERDAATSFEVQEAIARDKAAGLPVPSRFEETF